MHSTVQVTCPCVCERVRTIVKFIFFPESLIILNTLASASGIPAGQALAASACLPDKGAGLLAITAAAAAATRRGVTVCCLLLPHCLMLTPLTVPTSSLAYLARLSRNTYIINPQAVHNQRGAGRKHTVPLELRRGATTNLSRRWLAQTCSCSKYLSSFASPLLSSYFNSLQHHIYMIVSEPFNYQRQLFLTF